MFGVSICACDMASEVGIMKERRGQTVRPVEECDVCLIDIHIRQEERESDREWKETRHVPFVFVRKEGM